MKIKRWILAVLAALMVLTLLPLAAAASGQPSLVDTNVFCTVEPIFEFTLPPDATIRYPNLSMLVGQFSIDNLLLREGEQLTIDLTPGTMAARTNAGDVLPYTVSFNPPNAVDDSHIGQGYGVTVAIDPDAFDDATRTVYDADLLFRVRSELTGEVIWQGTTTVTALKAQPGGNDDDDNDGDIGGNDTEGVPDTGDNTIPGEEVPQANPDTQGDTGQPDENISDEETPQAQASVFWWWWIPVIVLGVLLLLLWLLLWRNVTVMVYGMDLLGQEELIRTVRQLKRKRDEVIVALGGKQVRGGVSGMIELSEALTKRMKGRALTVKVDGQRIYSTVIPGDIDGRFQTGFDGWME